MAPTTHPFRQVDVFSTQLLRGNPVAVVLDADGLDDASMQRLAAWTNLSETTFVSAPTSPDADYRVRIFTPGSELDFAGHPTLGTCHAWIEAGGRAQGDGVVVQESRIGNVAVNTAGERLAFAAPPSVRTELSPELLASVTSVLGITPVDVVGSQVLDNGPRWVTMLLDDAEAVLALKPDHGALGDLGEMIGVAGVTGDDSDYQVEVRGFAAANGIVEDPVTGSLNASLAQWLVPEGKLPSSYLAHQGSMLDRAGEIHVECTDDGEVWVGGHTATVIEGTITL